VCRLTNIRRYWERRVIRFHQFDTRTWNIDCFCTFCVQNSTICSWWQHSTETCWSWTSSCAVRRSLAMIGGLNMTRLSHYCECRHYIVVVDKRLRLKFTLLFPNRYFNFLAKTKYNNIIIWVMTDSWYW